MEVGGRVRERFEGAARPQAKECKWPLSAGKGKEIDSPLEPSEEIVAVVTLSF